MFGALSKREPTSISRLHDTPAEKPPPAAIRYFYASSFQIDDPFAPVPAPAATVAGPPREAPRPFSATDSKAIDKAWNRLRRTIKDHEDQLEKERIRKLREKDISVQASPRHTPRGDSRRGSGSRDVSVGKRLTHALVEAKHASGLGSRESSALSDAELSTSARTRVRSTSAAGNSKQRPQSIIEESADDVKTASPASAHFDIGESEQGTTGRPFVRAPSRSKAISGSWDDKIDSSTEVSTPATPQTALSRKQSAEQLPKPKEPPKTTLPVGVQKLHQVCMPSLQLEPIYWSPINDVAEVIRATWFYKDTMLPVESDVANMLESGYISYKPWSQTWKDELNSAVEVGPLGEEKIAHWLWPSLPAKPPNSRPGTATSSKTVDEGDTPESLKAKGVKVATDAIEAETKDSDVDHKAAGINGWGSDGRVRTYGQCKVIYADGKEAHILQSNLQPSAYYGRKPYADYIRKGKKLGVSVVRGFDQQAWDQLHPAGKAAKPTRLPFTTSSDAAKQPNSPAASQVPSGSGTETRVTDLILVIHGIGQKYSERNESYHFTHAMNAFRREVNAELHDNMVRPLMRPEMGGVMVLPVNWRSTLSFEDGGYRDAASVDAAANAQSDDGFSLKDITPDSLPQIRNIISDVMLDIPYYLSHHQPRMLAAVIREANRIHRTWCAHNPGFRAHGRVHLLAHSLGSVMALDILSRQPMSIDTAVTPLDGDEPEHLMFNTSNLFLCGSPAGFFLLLRKAGLRPRRETLDADAADAAAIGGEEGTYGCIAAQNIYNIVNPYDPVAYRMNAAIDAAYSASLKPAFVPRVSDSWFSFSPAAKSAYAADGAARPGASRLPSNVELETHDFTRESAAERRAFALNDNGQIDFFLRYGGGPLEIQYLTMLGAHSSYWLSKDFIRFVVVETGRREGREGALGCLRAVKKGVKR